jgi:hypothetical protein
MKNNLLQTSLFLIVLIFAVTAISAQSKAPKTVRDYFLLLPSKYFSLDCCMESTPKKSKEKYLEQYLDVEDTANGYMKGNGDGAQEAFEMALFKKTDGSYLIGFYTIGEGGVEEVPYTVFLQYRAGRWTDVSKTVIPGYAPTKRIYQIPRQGTTVEVFEKDEAASDFNKGKKLHDLVWKNGKFAVKKV